MVQRLAAGADALVQNYRPGVMERLGLGYEELRRGNRRLVYLSISGFAPEGPEAQRRSYDPIVQARSGVAATQGLARGERPEQVNQLLIDKLTALTASQALCAALFSAARSGEGQHVTVAMLDAAIAFLWPDAGADSILLGDGVEHHPPIGGAGHLTAYRDGWGATMTLSDAEFAGLCRAYDLDELAADARFNTLQQRQKHRAELKEMLEAVVAPAARHLSTDEAQERFDREGVPFGRVNSLAELPDDPQVKANELFLEREHPVAGRLRETRPAARFSATPPEMGAPAPGVGEHTREILAEIGMAGELAALLACRAVGVCED